MKLKRTFFASLLTLAVAAGPARSADCFDGPDSAKTIKQIKESVALATQWKESTFADRKFLFAITSEGDGESYIDLHGWVYNRPYKEWRRILNVKTRDLYDAKLLVDAEKGILS